MPSIRGKIQFDHKGIGDVLYGSRLRVPLNQREYSWEEEHVDDLFRDIAGAIANDKTHFLGTLVLTRGGDEIPEVSDGQQRLATTTILLAAIRDWFYRKGEKEQAESIETDFLRKYDRDENSMAPRLQLNVDDNAFFVRYILPKPDDEVRKTAEAVATSHKLIKQAATIAADRVRTIVALHNEHTQKTELNRWVKFITTNAQVIVLNVPDDLDAFVMFETLNDRGLKASQADLLKNYLLGQAKDDRIREAQQKWARMMGALDSLGQDDATLKYLHHLLITRLGPTRAAEIFDKVKGTISGQSQALRFLDEAAEGANDYAALFNPNHPKWNEYGTPTRHHISTINKDLQVQQIRPLMFAVARYFSVKEAQKTFQLFVYWSVRILIFGVRGGVLDRSYAIAAQKVGTKSITTAKSLTDELLHILPTDAQFQLAFAEARVSSASLARYYLRALEKKYKQEDEAEWVPSDDQTAINLEHILPENPQKEWPHIPVETANAYYKRIGNLVLLKATTNASIGNGSFEKKKAAFAASSYALTSMVAQFNGWDAGAIEQRQRVLAEWAVKTWPIRSK